MVHLNYHTFHLQNPPINSGHGTRARQQLSPIEVEPPPGKRKDVVKQPFPRDNSWRPGLLDSFEKFESEVILYVKRILEIKAHYVQVGLVESYKTHTKG